MIDSFLRPWYLRKSLILAGWLGALWTGFGLTFLTPVPPAKPASAVEWPIFRGTPALNGWAPWLAVPPLRKVWEADAGSPVAGSPVIADGRVFVATTGGKVLALRFQDGKTLWKRDIHKGIVASPSCFEHRVFIGDREGFLHALDAKTGKVLWQLETQGKIAGSVNFAGAHRIVVGSYDSNVYCLDARTGKPVWAFETEAQVHATPSVIRGNVITAGCDGFVRLLDASTGKQEKSIEIESNFACSPATDGVRFYLGTFTGIMIAVDPKQVNPIVWRHPTTAGQTFMASPATDGRNVVFAGRDGIVRCCSAATGEELWRVASPQRVDSSPVLLRNAVLVGGDDGVFSVLDLGDGHRLWSFDAGAAIPGAPAVADRRVVIAARDGGIYCFSGLAPVPSGGDGE